MKLLHKTPSIMSASLRELPFRGWFSALRAQWSYGTLLALCLPLLAILLWLYSLSTVKLAQMNDLGLVSIFSPLTLSALLLISLSFCLALRLRPLPVPLLLLHVVFLVFMLYGVTALLETFPRFSVVYRHAGFTEYIMRHGGVDPTLDAYFNWPGFFILTAFVTKIAGYSDLLAYAAWTPVFYNLLYLCPLYLIFSSATQDKRLVWLALWFFFLTNWIGQDYISPQGLNFFMYLVIIAILLTWFRTPPARQPHITLPAQGRVRRLAFGFYAWLRSPDLATPQLTRGQRVALLTTLLLVFAFVVFSHPLTPFFVLISVWALMIFRRCVPFWLPLVMTLMTFAWIGFMTQAYLAGHFSIAFGQGGLGSSVASNLTEHVSGNAQHTFIVQFRVLMTLLVWLLAACGGLLRYWRGYRDVTYAVLALAPFPLLLAQSYGGEMLLRIYLFTLPMMAFFAASLFYTWPMGSKRTLLTTSLACLLLLSGFLFTRYGNERMDYMTASEVMGVRQLYAIAPPGSLLIAGWAGAPWQFREYELYSAYTLADSLPEAVLRTDTDGVIQFIEKQEQARETGSAYILFTRSLRATVDATTSLPPGGLDRLSRALLATGKFKQVYSNEDTQILLYTPYAKGQK